MLKTKQSKEHYNQYRVVVPLDPSTPEAEAGKPLVQSDPGLDPCLILLFSDTDTCKIFESVLSKRHS